MGVPKILIACHCSQPVEGRHKKLFMRTNNSSIPISVEEIFGKGNVWYLDTSPECQGFQQQYSSWESLPDSTFDAIYLQHCPIYMDIQTFKKASNQNLFFDTPSKIFWTDVFIHAYRALKPHGGVVIPVESRITKPNPMMEYPVFTQTNTVNTVRKKTGKYYLQGVRRIMNSMGSKTWDIYLREPSLFSKNQFYFQSLPILVDQQGNTIFDQYLFMMKRPHQGGQQTRKLGRSTRKNRRIF